MAAAQFGLAGAIWGTKDETTCIITNMQEAATAENTELPNGQGDIVATVVHGKKATFTADFVVKTTGFPASALIGTIFTPADTANFDGSYIITGATKERQQGGFMSGQITGMRYYPDLALVTTTTTTT